MTNPQIHRLTAAEWARLRDVRLRALADSPDAFCSTLAAEQQLESSVWQARAADDHVAQFVAIGPDRGDVGMVVGAPHTDIQQTAGLFGMWVAPEARRQGVGQALVNAVIDWARTKKYHQVILDVAGENAPAIRLYETCGFRPNGRISTLPPPRNHIAERQYARPLQ